jgi:hypothetical protein
MEKKVTNIYVDNKRFLELLIAHQQAVRDAPEGKPPRVPEEIGDILIKISTNMAKLHKFRGYPFKEEMIGDAILNSLQAIKNFDPEKFSNPFGYFSKIVFWCFLRRIAYEKKELSGKAALMFEVDTYEDDGDHFISKDETYLWYNQ